MSTIFFSTATPTIKKKKKMFVEPSDHNFKQLWLGECVVYIVMTEMVLNINPKMRLMVR